MNILNDIPVVPDFVGRRNELKKLHELLFHQRNDVLVVGPAGCGKTSFVQQYARKFASSYSSGAIVSAATVSSPSAFFSALARNLGLESTDIDLLRQFLQAQRALVILDGLDEMAPSVSDSLYMHLRHLMQMRGDSRFLLTSRVIESVSNVSSPL